MNLPNLITLSRLGIALIAFVLMLKNFWKAGFVLILIAVLMDILDGIVARKYNQVTLYGIFLDIMADKIVIISTFLIIGFKINAIFFYLGILMLLREYSMDTFRSIIASQKKVLSADKFSKIKGIFLMFSMIFMIGNYIFLNNNLIIQWVISIIALITIVFSYFTLIRLILKHRL